MDLVRHSVRSSSKSVEKHFFGHRIVQTSHPTYQIVLHRHCAAAHSLSHLGPEGYHWRVLVEDKASGSEKSFSWWDIQDGNAKLPVKEASQYELRKLLFPSKPASSSSAKGAYKFMGKMATAVVGDDSGESHGPPVSVVCFKLLDLVKIHDDFDRKHGGNPPPVARAQQRPRAAPAPRPAPRAQPAPRPQQPRAQAQPSAQQAAPRRAPAPAPKQEASLMDFGDNPSSGNRKNLRHAMSSPPSMGGNPNETRAERLKREYEKKKNTANRVWDDIDQRWVEVEPGAAPPGARNEGVAPPAAPKAKVVGIKLDGSSAAGKSVDVQAAVSKRVNDMQEQQAKAVNEMRAREAKKKNDDDEEDIIRRQLDPKIKIWSEEHGKKKQLSALLASLHTILWQGAKWKQITIGDLLTDGKVKKSFHKATLVVHPDKTHDLPADRRFLAKRIFDSLCQAKTEFDDRTK
jgi:hypothetical protein